MLCLAVVLGLVICFLRVVGDFLLADYRSTGIESQAKELATWILQLQRIRHHSVSAGDCSRGASLHLSAVE